MSINFALGDLRAFIAVAELASFRAAAEAIHLSQPALSRRIDKLEDALGVRLFTRNSRNVQLTAIRLAFEPRAPVLARPAGRPARHQRPQAAVHAPEVRIA